MLLSRTSVSTLLATPEEVPASVWLCKAMPSVTRVTTILSQSQHQGATDIQMLEHIWHCWPNWIQRPTLRHLWLKNSFEVTIKATKSQIWFTLRNLLQTIRLWVRVCVWGQRSTSGEVPCHFLSCFETRSLSKSRAQPLTEADCPTTPVTLLSFWQASAGRSVWYCTWLFLQLLGECKG